MFEQFAKEISLPLSGKPIEYALAGTDMSGPVRSLGDQGADAVMIGGSTCADHGLIAKTMVEQGVDIPIIESVGVGFPDAFEVGGDAYDSFPGADFPASVDTEKPAFKEFKEAYEAEYDAKQQYPTRPRESTTPRGSRSRHSSTPRATAPATKAGRGHHRPRAARRRCWFDRFDHLLRRQPRRLRRPLVTYQAKGGSNQQVTIE